MTPYIFLSNDVTKTLMYSFVLSRLHYANSLLANFLKKSIQRLQKVQNAAARLTLKLRKTERTTPALKQLHWLPIEARIFTRYVFTVTTFFTQPLQLTSLRYLQSTLLVAPFAPINIDFFFLPYGLRIRHTANNLVLTLLLLTHWNSLPYEIRQQKSLHTFKKDLKTYLSRLYFC